MVNIFDRFTKKGTTGTSENVPYAFSHIAAGAPPSVYMSMTTGNTFDEAMQETNNIPMPEDDMGLDIDLALDPELDDPDAIEKAIYQLRIAEEKEIEPEEVLETPYGPGLSGEEIDLLLDAYPALDAGIDLDMIDENFDEVDRMLNKSGEGIEAAMDAAEQRAEDEGDIGASPVMMRQLGDSLGNSVEAMLNPRNPYEAMLGQSFDQDTFNKVLLNASNGEWSGDQSVTAVPETTWDTLDRDKVYPPDITARPEYTPKIIGQEIGEMAEDPNEVSPITPERMEWVNKWIRKVLQPKKDGSPMTDQEIWDTLNELLITQEDVHAWIERNQEGITEEQLRSIRLYTPATAEDLGLAKPEKVATDTLVNENLTKTFYTTMYTYPESGQSDIRDSLPLIFNDTRTLFFLHEGKEAWKIMEDITKAVSMKQETTKTKELGNLEANYQQFLYEYLADPVSKRTGEDFRNKITLISNVLSYAAANPDRNKWDEAMPLGMSGQEFKELEFWVEPLFGTTDEQFGETNRRNLIKIAATQGGQGWYSRLIHRSVDRVMDYYKNIGLPAEERMARMARLTGLPVTDPNAKNPVVDLADQISAVQNAGDLEWSGGDPLAFTPPPTTPPTTPPITDSTTDPITDDVITDGKTMLPTKGWWTKPGEITNLPANQWSEGMGDETKLPQKSVWRRADGTIVTPPSTPVLPLYGEWSGAGQSDFMGDQSFGVEDGLSPYPDPLQPFGVPSEITMESLMPPPEEQDYIDRILSPRELLAEKLTEFIPGQYPDIEETLDAPTGRIFTFQDYLEREAAKQRIYDQRRQPVRVTPPFWVTDRNRPSL